MNKHCIFTEIKDINDINFEPKNLAKNQEDKTRLLFTLDGKKQCGPWQNTNTIDKSVLKLIKGTTNYNGKTIRPTGWERKIFVNEA